MSESQEWLGRSVTLRERLDPGRARAMQATLGRAPSLEQGDALPPLWHWLYFWDTPRIDLLGADGHAEKGGFLPPIQLPYRMWAGGRLTFHRAPALGDFAEKTSTIAGIRETEGRSGPLTFVTVRHEIADGDGTCLEEEQDIVYRGALPASAQTSTHAPEDYAWRRAVSPGPVLLFRYSALTFNGHRIHYDQPYATGEEGYPGLVVHGPLLATLLVDLALEEGGGKPPARFAFRALKPVFDRHAFTLAGSPGAGSPGAGRSEPGEDDRLWVADHEGALAMEASFTPSV